MLGSEVLRIYPRAIFVNCGDFFFFLNWNKWNSWESRQTCEYMGLQLLKRSSELQSYVQVRNSDCEFNYVEFN